MQSAVKREPDLATVTCPANPRSKYLSIVSPIRASMRERNASPMSMCFPDMRRLMRTSAFPSDFQTERVYTRCGSAQAQQCRQRRRPVPTLTWSIAVSRPDVRLGRRPASWARASSYSAALSINGRRLPAETGGQPGAGVRRWSWRVFRAGAAPRRECSCLPDTWRPCAARFRCHSPSDMSTIASSESTSIGLFLVDHLRMRSRTASEECASPPPDAAIEAVKK